ncbi:hypothetical protein MHU86_6547 [Fragilaria crotonensis]|nr:hypothetical protein MHU86_6547 [Fragilaria crotonensis]
MGTSRRRWIRSRHGGRHETDRQKPRWAPYDWSKMLTWNSTSDVRRAIEELVTTRSSVSGVSEAPDRHRRGAEPPPVAATRGRPKKGSAPRGRSSRANILGTNDQDKTNDADATTQKTSRSSVSP